MIFIIIKEFNLRFVTFRMKSRNAVFLMRDSAILKDIPTSHIARYKDTEPLCREHLKVCI